MSPGSAGLSVRKTARYAGEYRGSLQDSKRQAHSKVVEMVLNGSKTGEKSAFSAIGS